MISYPVFKIRTRIVVEEISNLTLAPFCFHIIENTTRGNSIIIGEGERGERRYLISERETTDFIPRRLFANA